MKKSLSAILATSMAFSMFASAAFAADPLTTEAKFQQLKTAGVFQGINGESHLDQLMTRAEFAKALATLLKLENKPAAAASFKDVTATHWAIGQIGALAEAKIIEGIGAGKFGPKANVSLEQVAKIAVTALKLEVKDDAKVEGKTSAWATKYVAAAVAAGLIQTSTDYTKNATRGNLVDASFEVFSKVSNSVKEAKVIDDKNIEVTFADGGVVKKELTTALEAGKATKVEVEYKGNKYTVEVTLGAISLVKAAQTNAREITVDFNRPLSATESAALTYEVKNGLINYTVTPKWSEDKKSVVLTSTFLPAAEYDLTVKGFPAQKVKVEDEKPSKIDISATSVQKVDGQSLGVKLLNQFDKEITNAAVTVTVFNATKGATINPASGTGVGAKYDLKSDDVAKVDDSIVVTATHSSGITATKTYKVVAGSAATKIVLGTVAPLKDKTRITAGDAGLVVPTELTDQYGTKITLKETAKTAIAADANNFVVSGITFMINQLDTITHFAVDKDGVLTIDTKAGKSGTIVLNAVNPATGANASTSFKVEATTKVKTLQISAPGSVVAAGEDVAFAIAAVDQFGGQIAAKDVKVTTATTPAAGEVKIQSNIALTKAVINAKGELVLRFASEGVAYVYAYVDNEQVGSVQGLTVNKAATAVKVSGVKDVATTIAAGVSVDFDEDNILYIDSYNRTKNVAADAYEVSLAANTGVLSYTGGKLVAGANAGTVEVTVKLKGVATGSEYKFNVTVVKTDDVKSYAVKTIGTVYGGKENGAAIDSDSKYAVTVNLVGKLQNGTEVAINQTGAYNFLTSSDTSVLAVSGTKVYGLKAGTSTVTAYDASGTKLAEQVVTVSEAAPVATKVELDKTEYSAAVAGTATVKVVVKDQYGASIAPNGTLVSNDSKVATVARVDAATYTITGVAVGTATLTYWTNNAVQGTATVAVNP
ncbi:S-layer homology domain-containing protein [Paenibacillus xanthanilyticus]|uniref:S-layer homology domain-containing protein n=1 Tax=Paenibacillus xanthanilyticus TaxID=1783531 RepID=A0ABV8K2Z4_9BACL